jgi:hypothetical protein
LTLASFYRKFFNILLFMCYGLFNDAISKLTKPEATQSKLKKYERMKRLFQKRMRTITPRIRIPGHRLHYRRRCIGYERSFVEYITEHSEERETVYSKKSTPRPKQTPASNLARTMIM